MHLQTLVIINSALILFSNNMHETQLYIDKDTFTGTYLNILDLQNKMRYRRPHILQNVNRSREVLSHKPEDLRDLSYCQTHQRILFSPKKQAFPKDSSGKWPLPIWVEVWCPANSLFVISPPQFISVEQSAKLVKMEPGQYPINWSCIRSHQFPLLLSWNNNCWLSSYIYIIF